jgi:hypothetical protein
MRFGSFILLILLTACATQPFSTEKKDVAPAPLLLMTEVNPNKWTALTQQNLNHLLQVYHLAPLIFTKEIRIESKVIPHSHPVLTLNTRHAEEPFKLLSVFLHEQFHWWTEQKSAEVEMAIKDLRLLFPELPKAGVAKDEHSTYLHLIICFLEYDSLIFYLKKKEANKILKDLTYKDKIYPWIYKQVYIKYNEIESIVLKSNLRPER